MGIVKRTMTGIASTVSKWIDTSVLPYVGAGWFNLWSSGGNQEDVKAVDYYRAEPYVYGCTSLISTALSNVPLRLYRYKDDGSKEVVKNHPFYQLIDKPNFMATGKDLLEWACANYLLTGKVYLYIPSKTEIILLNSSKTNIEIKKTIPKNASSWSDVIDYIEYTEGEQKIRYTPDEVLFEHSFSLRTTIGGESPLSAISDSVQTNILARRANAGIFKNGMRVDGVFETDKPMPKDAETIKRAKAYYEDNFKGANNSHRVPMLWDGLKFKQITMSPQDMDYINGMKLNRSEICACVFQVPEILLGAYENSSYNNMTEALKMFYMFAVQPRGTKIAELFQRVFDRLYGQQDVFVEFDYSGIQVLAEDRSKKIVDLTALISAGITRNEAVRYLDLPFDTKDPSGDVRYLPFSLSPQGSSRSQEPVNVVDEDDEEDGEDTVKVVDREAERKAFIAKCEQKIAGIQWTPELKKKKWDNFKSLTDTIDLAYRKDLKDYFGNQHKEMVRRLNQYKGMTLEPIQDGVSYLVADNGVTKNPIDMDDVLFRDKIEVDRLRAVSSKHHRDALVKQGMAEMQLLDLGIEFSVTNPRIKEFLEQYGLEKAKTVLSTAKQDLKDAMIAGLEAGEGIPKIADRLAQVYEAYEDIAGYKLQRIAQTEVIGAANQGALESYDQIGSDKIRKGWLPAYINTRDSHLKAGQDYGDGNEIPLDELFVVGNGVCLTPGQTGVAEEDIQCSCTLIPQVKQ